MHAKIFEQFTYENSNLVKLWDECYVDVLIVTDMNI